MKWPDHEAIDYVSYGATILANGGGGDPYIGKIMAQRTIAKYGPIRLLTLDELQPEELLLATSMIDSSAVIMEKFPNDQESLPTCRIIAQHMGRLSAITRLKPTALIRYCRWSWPVFSNYSSWTSTLLLGFSRVSNDYLLFGRP